MPLETVPEGHFVQDVKPWALAMNPELQAVHMADPADGAKVPRAHGMQPSPTEPSDENCGAVPAEHGVQSANELAAGLEELGVNIVPAGQPVHFPDRSLQ